MSHIFVDFIFLFVIVFLVILIYLRQIRHKKLSDDLIKVLSKNVDFLTDFYHRQEIVSLKNTIQLYSQFQVLLKISKCDYISFFKYDFTKRYVTLHFILSIDDRGFIVQESMLDKLPVTSNLLTLSIIKTDDKDLYSTTAHEMREKDEKVY